MSAFTINTQAEGNLGNDPTLRTTSNGTAVANFRMAVTQQFRNAAGTITEHTEWINVVVWGEMARNVQATLRKGHRAIVTGNLKQRSFEGREGDTIYTTELHADSVGLSLRWHVAAGVEKAKEALPGGGQLADADEPVAA